MAEKIDLADKFEGLAEDLHYRAERLRSVAHSSPDTDRLVSLLEACIRLEQEAATLRRTAANLRQLEAA